MVYLLITLIFFQDNQHMQYQVIDVNNEAQCQVAGYEKALQLTENKEVIGIEFFCINTELKNI